MVFQQVEICLWKLGAIMKKNTVENLKNEKGHDAYRFVRSVFPWSAQLKRKQEMFFNSVVYIQLN